MYARRGISRGSALPSTVVDGIQTRYEVLGDGPPLLMYSPGGFDGTLEKWSTQGIYARIKLLDHLPQKYSCIVFDRRETGQSGGRVEVLTWKHYMAQGKGLLDHLNIRRAHLMGACMGCCPVVAFAVGYPEMVRSMVLYWPVGGAKYRINNRRRFADHVDFVAQHSLADVAALAMRDGKTFGEDPRVGPWASVLRRERAFAEAFAKLDREQYKRIVSDTSRALYDRDTAPGAEPEELMRLDIPALVIPGKDASHATSAARYLEECLRESQYWDVAPEGQIEASAPVRVLEFLEMATARRGS
jgi:pimeloyl-ACP methyl ester carboxylesterase